MMPSHPVGTAVYRYWKVSCRGDVFAGRSRGLTLIEMVIVMTLIGLISAIAYPKLGSTLTRQDINGARSMITTMHAKARAAAVSRGRRTAMALTAGNLVIISRNPVSGVADTVGTPENVRQRYGVSVTVNPSNRDSLIFDSRGIGTESATTWVYVTKGGFADTIEVAPLGRIKR